MVRGPATPDHVAHTDAERALHEKIRLEIGVSEPYVDIVVQAVMHAARTGDVGDGKIFVIPVEKVYRICTGEQDVMAVTPPTVKGSM